MVGEYIEKAIRTVGRERLLVILLEDLHCDTKATYKVVLEFLGVDDDARDYFPRLNESKSIKSNFIVKAILIAQVVRREIQLPNISARLAIKLDGLGIQSMGKPDISKEIFEILRCSFQADIEKLSALIDRDLTHWLGNQREGGP